LAILITAIVAAVSLIILSFTILGVQIAEVMLATQ